MHDINRFIGIKHIFNGSSFDGLDCVGLCRLFYKEHNWNVPFDDGKSVEHDWYLKTPLRLIKYLYRNFDKCDSVNNLNFGDIVYFRINDEGHVGIYISYGKILSMQVPVVEGGTQSTIYRKIEWEPYFIMGFKRRVDK